MALRTQGRKGEDLLAVEKGDLVYHFGDLDHDDGWVWATVARGPRHLRGIRTGN